MCLKVRVLLVFNTTCVLLLANSVWCVAGSILILQLFVNISILISLPAYGFSSFARWVFLNRDSFDFYISTDFEEIIWAMITGLWCVQEKLLIFFFVHFILS